MTVNQEARREFPDLWARFPSVTRELIRRGYDRATIARAPDAELLEIRQIGHVTLGWIRSLYPGTDARSKPYAKKRKGKGAAG